MEILRIWFNKNEMIKYEQALISSDIKIYFTKYCTMGASNKFYNIIKLMYNNFSLAIQSRGGDNIHTYFFIIVGSPSGG